MDQHRPRHLSFCKVGVDHKKLTYKFQGRDFRFTDVFGNVVNEILA